jgi:lipopolysaccharide biosynthesis regulator YciM
MEIEFWWLLALPIFFALGWLAARIDMRQVVSESRSVPRSYYRGINFLVNEQSDKAIEAFIEVVKLDPETIELHFALGSLFRRRGEVERAIRMHQNLADRPDLAPEQRETAVHELAQDYRRAGLLDRAEELFAKLTTSAHRESALRALLDIYEQEKDWEKAIATARALTELTGHSHQKEIAAYWCEIADDAIMHSRPADAHDPLGKALAEHRPCVRANFLLGEAWLAEGNVESAIDAWKRIENQSPLHLALVGEKLLEAFRSLGRPDEGRKLLAGYLSRYGSIDLLNVVFQATLERDGTEPAYRIVRDELRRNPTLLGLDKLLEAQLIDTPPERRPDLELVKTLVNQHTRTLAMYRCDNCGFRARQFYWHCPACGGWETYSPRRTEEKGLPA